MASMLSNQALSKKFHSSISAYTNIHHKSKRYNLTVISTAGEQMKTLTPINARLCCDIRMLGRHYTFDKTAFHRLPITFYCD